MVYSCAFFDQESDSLEVAQERKLQTTIQRLGIQPGDSVAEIGCGWGALSQRIAKLDVSAVLAVTISERQYKYCLEQPNPPSSLEFRFQDYRELASAAPGSFNRVVSIGMFEHVGRSQFQTYFEAVRDLLEPGGTALIHTIVRSKPGITNAWIDKYIFPGGYIAPLDEIEAVVAKVNNLSISKIFTHDGENYVRTLSAWEHNLKHSKLSIIESYDEHLFKTFEFYLAGSKAAFSDFGMKVCQIVMHKDK